MFDWKDKVLPQKCGCTADWMDGRLHIDECLYCKNDRFMTVGCDYGKVCEKTCECYLCYFKRNRRQANATGAFWYSVRPPHTMKPLEFKSKIEKFLQGGTIAKAIYNFEFKYDEKKQPYGVHCHMLVWARETKKFNQHIKRQKDSFWSLCLDKQLFSILNKDMNERIPDKIKYMTGITWSEIKNDEKLWDFKTRVEKLGVRDQLIFYKCDPCDFGVTVKKLTPKFEDPGENLYEYLGYYLDK
ncbi:MAG: putative replicase [Cressdnaviricota sp.]|nr:MAG: putative replicase [Cressdnaviricota sp.]